MKTNSFCDVSSRQAQELSDDDDVDDDMDDEDDGNKVVLVINDDDDHDDSGSGVDDNSPLHSPKVLASHTNQKRRADEEFLASPSRKQKSRVPLPRAAKNNAISPILIFDDDDDKTYIGTQDHKSLPVTMRVWLTPRLLRSSSRRRMISLQDPLLRILLRVCLASGVLIGRCTETWFSSR